MNETPKSRVKIILVDFLIPLTILMSFSTFFLLTDFDLEFESIFWDLDRGSFIKRVEPWYFLYKFGPAIPGFALFCFFAALVGGFFSDKLKKYRKMSIYAILVVVIGPGLICNAIFKEHWGRPRPYNVKGLGGSAEFLPLFVKGPYVPNESQIARTNKKTGLFWELYKKYYPPKCSHNSFPSGHASFAFFLYVFFFILRKTKHKRAILWAATAYGGLMGFGRNVQGGHFPSDILWAAGFVYLTALTFYYLMSMDKSIWYEKNGKTAVSDDDSISSAKCEA